MDFVWIVLKYGFQNSCKVIGKLILRCCKLVVNKLGVNMEINVGYTRNNLTNIKDMDWGSFFTSSNEEPTVVTLPLQWFWDGCYCKILEF